YRVRYPAAVRLDQPRAVPRHARLLRGRGRSIPVRTGSSVAVGDWAKRCAVPDMGRRIDGPRMLRRAGRWARPDDRGRAPDRARRGLPMAATAAAGVVLGHWLTYVLAIPQGEVRAQILLRAGHGYWIYAMQAAVAMGIVAVGSLVLRHVRFLTEGAPPGDDRF